jgi:hypothetical protein
LTEVERKDKQNGEEEVHQLINWLVLFAAGGDSTSDVDWAVEQENIQQSTNRIDNNNVTG